MHNNSVSCKHGSDIKCLQKDMTVFTLHKIHFSCIFTETHKLFKYFD